MKFEEDIYIAKRNLKLNIGNLRSSDLNVGNSKSSHSKPLIIISSCSTLSFETMVKLCVCL